MLLSLHRRALRAKLHTTIVAMPDDCKNGCAFPVADTLGNCRAQDQRPSLHSPGRGRVRRGVAQFLKVKLLDPTTIGL
jgi:hypothetical protein